MPDLLLEVGTEELPSGAVAGALDQLQAAVANRLSEARLAAQGVRVYGTPRRMVVYATGVPERQPDQSREAKGPAKSVAFDGEGKPTGAAMGFARKQGVPVDALEVVSTSQGEYVMARVMDVGRSAVEVLGGLLTEAVLGLTFPKMMRWGGGGLRFARPVRWIVALLGSEVVPMEIAGVTSGRESRGHRFLAPQPFEVPDAGSYFGLIRDAFVEIEPEKRGEMIVEQGTRLAESAEGQVPWDLDLLDENQWLVEWPTALLGSFDPQYLELPRPVLITAMKKHQRFFPVEGPDGNLLPRFISVRNGGDRALDQVREGNERVLTARFADASFFYKQDQAQPLEAFTERLSRILFQEKLGTLHEKRLRLERLMGALADASGLPAEQAPLAVRAAKLCKADLATQMVMELPALQGVVGREYALAAGEPPLVAEAIAEHYQPRSASDTLPASPIGRLLAVADRMDTLVGYVGIGILPSGSSDPYGLRRAAHGVVQILADDVHLPSLLGIAVQAARAYREENGLDFPLDPLCNDLRGLFNQRLEAYLQERDIRYDLIAAALSGSAIYSTLVYGVVRRAFALQALAGDLDFVPTVTVAGRVANILRSAGLAAGPPPGFAHLPPVRGEAGEGGSSGERSAERAVSVLESLARAVDRDRLTEESERRLFEEADRLVPEVARLSAEYDYPGVYRTLTPLRATVDRFFDDVLVMAEDPAVRQNRLALLSFVDALYKTLADFTKVVVTQTATETAPGRDAADVRRE